jgi:plasmid stabilization system protein ParE
MVLRVVAMLLSQAVARRNSNAQLGELPAALTSPTLGNFQLKRAVERGCRVALDPGQQRPSPEHLVLRDVRNSRVSRGRADERVSSGSGEFPHRGLARDDIRAGLRSTSYKRRTVVGLRGLDDVVAIIGIFHGGRDYEAILGASEP